MASREELTKKLEVLTEELKNEKVKPLIKRRKRQPI